MRAPVDDVLERGVVSDGNPESTGRRGWARGARLTLVRDRPPRLDRLAASPACGAVLASAYRLRNRLQRDAGHLRRLLDGADLSDPALQRRVRLAVGRLVQALLDAEEEF